MDTVHQAQQQFKEGTVSAQELVQESFKTMDGWDPHIHAFLQRFEEEAVSKARHIDAARQKNETLGLLAGLPIAVKDNIVTKTGRTTAGSKILESYTAPFNATVINRLEDAGAIIIGKTNLDEFAMGSSTEYSAFGPTKNPWNLSHVPGGSSGGSAAAVAAGIVPAALGTDTGGSIRQPASFCGVVGVKPTYGRVSRFGVISYGSSLDQVGPFARTVQDAALLLSVMAGQDEYDATTSNHAVGDYVAACQQASVKGLTIGVPKEFFEEGMSIDLAAVVRKAIAWFEEQGAQVKEVSLPLTSAGVAVYYLIAKAEASVNLARYDALRFGPMDLRSDDLLARYMEARGSGFGPEVKRAIIMGTYALSAGYYDAWYKQASKVRTLIRREYEEVFKSVDIMLGPVSPEGPFTFGSKTADPLQMYLADSLTVPISVAGLPALSLPCGSVNGLPVGLQVIAPHFKEAAMFAAAHTYEQAHDWWQQVPVLPQ